MHVMIALSIDTSRPSVVLIFLMRIKTMIIAYMHEVECKVCKWTDNVKVKVKFRFCHIKLQALLLAVEV